MRLTTKNLILKFQTELCDQCVAARDKEDRGHLTISIAYLQTRQLVEVNVVSAKNLPGLNKSGEKEYTLNTACTVLFMYMTKL